MKTAIEYLKNAMSVKYCGKTRFDFLDPEEVILVEKAMESYSLQQNSEKDKRIAELEEALQLVVRQYTNDNMDLAIYSNCLKALNSHGKQE